MNNSGSLPCMNEKYDFLRHTLATVAYRGAKAVRGAPPEFAGYRCNDSSRTPGQILAHLGDLYDWALSIANGKQEWHDSQPLPWEQEVERFFAALKRFDDRIASGEPLADAPEKLFQGAVADSLTHIGQIAMLRRMAGSAIKGESYYRADISICNVGTVQATPKREFA